MPEPLELGILLAWGAYLAWGSAVSGPNFASWHMFAGVSHIRFHLHDRYGRRFNCWHFLPHSKLGLSVGEAELLLIYVSRVHGMNELCGTLVHRNDFTITHHSVINSKLVE